MKIQNLARKAKLILPQTTPGLDEEIREYGCIWSCDKGISQILADTYLTPAQLNYEWNLDKTLGNLLKFKDGVQVQADQPGYWLALRDNHAKIIQRGYRSITGKNIDVALVDQKTLARPDLVGPSKAFSWWDKVKDFTILGWLTAGNFTHFTLGDGDETEIFNPWPGLPVKKLICVLSFKIMGDLENA